MSPVPRRAPPPPTPAELARSVGFFALTCASVHWTYGTTWAGGSGLEPFTSPALALRSAQFATGLMSILLAHELGHWVVARRHGVDQGLPMFLPFPLAFGTLGAIIRLRSLPPHRSALIEIGAAGPLAGFAVAVLVMALGLPGTVDAGAPVVELPWPMPPMPAPAPSSWDWLGELLGATSVQEGLPLMIMANPPLMDLLGVALLGAPPGRYAELGPLALAGWAGCFLTAMNLLPVGQLDGGHVTNGLAPGWARRLSRAALLLVVVLGLLGWKGWVVWSVLLFGMGAIRSLPIRDTPVPSRRALWVAGFAALTFALCWMAEPIEMETVPWGDLRVRTPEGLDVPQEELRLWAAGGGSAP